MFTCQGEFNHRCKSSALPVAIASWGKHGSYWPTCKEQGWSFDSTTNTNADPVTVLPETRHANRQARPHLVALDCLLLSATEGLFDLWDCSAVWGWGFLSAISLVNHKDFQAGYFPQLLVLLQVFFLWWLWETLRLFCLCLA